MKKFFLLCFALSLALFCISSKGDWININESVANAPHFKVINVYSGQKFSIKWDNLQHGAFIGGNAVVRFRAITKYKDIVGVINNFPDNQGITITSTNWVYAEVKKSGVLIIYAPFSKTVTLLPDIFLAARTTVSAWENKYPLLGTAYRIKAFKTNSIGNNPYPKYFNELKVDSQSPLNYGCMDKCSNAKAFVVGVNVISDFISANNFATCAPYSFSTLNKYYFHNYVTTNEASDKVFANDREGINYTHFGIKSVIAVFLLSNDAYIDCPVEVNPPEAGYYYETDTADAIKDCHFWSYAKRLKPEKYDQIKNYKGYYAQFPIGLLKYKTQHYAHPCETKDADYGVTFFNPVQNNTEQQKTKSGFSEYIYSDNLNPVKK